jgi:hypothetical protein
MFLSFTELIWLWFFCAANKKIQQWPEALQKDDEQHPHDFLPVAQPFIGNGMNEQPYPNNEIDCADRQTHRAGEERD